MKKKIYFFLILCGLGVFSLKAQEQQREARKKWQLSINATNLLRQATGISPTIPIITSPYDLQLTYTQNSRFNIRLGFGYQIPEQEAPTGAVNEASRIDYTLHTRFGFSWNKHFGDNWVWANGFDMVYSRRLEKEFDSDDVLSLHIITDDTGAGGSSNLQYYFTPQFSLGAEMALYISMSVRNRILPIPEPFGPFTDFQTDPFFFENDTQLNGSLYAPIELFMNYRF